MNVYGKQRVKDRATNRLNVRKQGVDSQRNVFAMNDSGVYRYGVNDGGICQAHCFSGTQEAAVDAGVAKVKIVVRMGRSKDVTTHGEPVPPPIPTQKNSRVTCVGFSTVS